MNRDQRKDWRELCKQAANEQDPEKLMALVVEINRALDERDQDDKSRVHSLTGVEA
jgi:hypothetical protein